MARGILAKWRFPLFYEYDLNMTLDKLIEKRHRNVRDARKTAQFMNWVFFIENDEINIDEILVGNFIHDCSGRNDIYLVLIKASSVIANYLDKRIKNFDKSKIRLKANRKVSILKIKTPKPLINCTLVFRHFRFSYASCPYRLIVYFTSSHPWKSWTLLWR